MTSYLLIAMSERVVFTYLQFADVKTALFTGDQQERLKRYCEINSIQVIEVIMEDYSTEYAIAMFGKTLAQVKGGLRFL